jgi:hypothetical protein
VKKLGKVGMAELESVAQVDIYRTAAAAAGARKLDS